MTVANLAALARGVRLEKTFLDKVRSWLDIFLGTDRGTEELDPSLLEKAGWGVIFPRDGDPKIRTALRPLLDWRKSQAAARDELRYREFWGDDGYRRGESMYDFLLQHDAEFGTVDPRQMPYYLLLVGSPEEIPFSFQYDLDVLYAVGRLDLGSPKEYASYAESVIATERARTPSSTSPLRMAFFCPDNLDEASIRARRELVGGLTDRFAAAPQEAWSLDSVLDDFATPEGLCHLLGGGGTPNFLFTACHGLVFPSDDPRLRHKQGALLCQTRGRTTTLKAAVSADEITDRAEVHGLVAFQFACFSAGTPGIELGEELEPTKTVVRSEKAFTARLPQRLLGHPNGGALAVIGHVSRAWTYSFSGFGKAPQLNTFEDTIRRILRGERVGFALEHFNLSFASKAGYLMNLRELETIAPSNGKRDAQLALAYCIAKDARNYVVLGDPAVSAAPTHLGPEA